MAIPANLFWSFVAAFYAALRLVAAMQEFPKHSGRIAEPVKAAGDMTIPNTSEKTLAGVMIALGTLLGFTIAPVSLYTFLLVIPLLASVPMYLKQGGDERGPLLRALALTVGGLSFGGIVGMGLNIFLHAPWWTLPAAVIITVGIMGLIKAWAQREEGKVMHL